MIARCKYCDREFVASAEGMHQNSYCSACLNERLAKAAAANPVIRWEACGQYMIPIREKIEC